MPQKRKEGVKMAKDFLTDGQVEAEIERLTKSPYVQLTRAEQRIKYRRRQYLYQLRNMEKHGKELQAAGITLEILRQLEANTPESEI